MSHDSHVTLTVQSCDSHLIYAVDHHRQEEGCSLPRASLGNANDVTPTQASWDRLRMMSSVHTSHDVVNKDFNYTITGHVTSHATQVTWDCIPVGWLYSDFRMMLIKLSSKLKCAKETQGLGTR